MTNVTNFPGNDSDVPEQTEEKIRTYKIETFDGASHTFDGDAVVTQHFIGIVRPEDQILLFVIPITSVMSMTLISEQDVPTSVN